VASALLHGEVLTGSDAGQAVLAYYSACESGGAIAARTPRAVTSETAAERDPAPSERARRQETGRSCWRRSADDRPARGRCHNPRLTQTPSGSHTKGRHSTGSPPHCANGVWNR